MTYRLGTLRGRYPALLFLLTFPAIHCWAQTEPKAGQWNTWVLSSGNQLRLPAPPPTNGNDLTLLRNFIAARNPAALEQITFWDTGSPAPVPLPPPADAEPSDSKPK